MTQSFKPLALAAAVSAVSVGTAGVANAQGEYPSLGDAAFVPYYTVEQDWVTGVHIINSSEYTQVVKLRLRRAEDSLDVLDFNLILSPKDVWTGTISGDDTEMRFITEDNTCTAPVLLDNGDGRTYAPVFGPRIEGAQEGYLEVIGMAQADDEQPISVDAEHGADGVPADCDAVREHFFADAISDFDVTLEDDSKESSQYMDTDNVLKVSYFIRDNESGIEFGNNAVHFTDFADDAMMSHQEFGLEAYANNEDESLFGWDFPDVRGGTSLNSTRSSIYVVRDQLGANVVLNDWSYNPATGAATDWVVTFPGQYALVDWYQLEEFVAGDEDAEWDFREIPVTATFDVLDREEDEATPGGLGFSPSPAPDAAFLPYEVNVVTWGGNDVLHSNYTTDVPPPPGIDAPYGWASLSVEADGGPTEWCDVAAGPQDGENGDECVMTSVSGPVPMVGFAAWERTFSEDSDRNYGRIVEHSFTTED